MDNESSSRRVDNQPATLFTSTLIQQHRANAAARRTGGDGIREGGVFVYIFSTMSRDRKWYTFDSSRRRFVLIVRRTARPFIICLS